MLNNNLLDHKLNIFISRSMQNKRHMFYSEPPANVEDGQRKKKVVLFLWLLNKANWARGQNFNLI